MVFERANDLIHRRLSAVRVQFLVRPYLSLSWEEINMPGYLPSPPLRHGCCGRNHRQRVHPSDGFVWYNGNMEENPYRSPASVNSPEERTAPPARFFLLRSFLWFAFGVWAFQVAVILLEAVHDIYAEVFWDRLAMNPVLALLLGGLFVAWLEIRTLWRKPRRQLPLISFLAGILWLLLALLFDFALRPFLGLLNREPFIGLAYGIATLVVVAEINLRILWRLDAKRPHSEQQQ